MNSERVNLLHAGATPSRVESGGSTATEEAVDLSVRHTATRRRSDPPQAVSDDHYRTVLATIQDAYYECDVQGRLTYVNDAYVTVFGYATHADALRGNYREYADGLEARRAIFAAFSHVYRTGEPCPALEYSIIDLTGRRRWVTTSISLMRDQAGRVAGFCGICRDNTERVESRMALQQSEERLQTIFATALDGIVIFDDELNYLDANPAALKIFGLTKEELLRHRISDFVLPQQRAGFDQFLATLQREGAAAGTFVREVAGREVIIEYHVAAHFLPGQHLGTMRDVTGRERAEAELRKSEERYRLLFERNLAGVYRSTFTGQLLQANRALARILGYDSVAQMQQVDTWTIYVNRDDRVRMLELISQWGRLNNYELQLRRRDGTPIWTLSNIMMVKGADGHDLLEGVVLDISEQKRAEALLVESRERYKALFEHSFAGIYRTTLDGRLLDCNDALARIFGFASRAELMKVNTAELYFEARDHRDTVALALRDGRYANIERLRRRRDGQPVWTLSSGTVYESAEHGLVLEGIILDITDRKRAEEQLSRSREQLRALSARMEKVREEERKRIAREIHDELGQLMTGLKLDFAWIEKRITQTSDAALRSTLIPKLDEVAALLDTTIRSVRNIASQLRPGALDELGLLAAIEWQTQEFTKRAGIRWELRLCPEPPECKGERATGLFRIFQEITTNILRHAQATHVVVDLQHSGDELILTVTDNGIGISAEQLKNTRSLGLAGIRERALLLHGSVQIIRIEPAGTRVMVAIPLS